MIEAKTDAIAKRPLSPETREFAWHCVHGPDRRLAAILAELLAAEEFWREAVKNFSEDGSPNNSDPCCQFCGEYVPDHKLGCAWKLAQS